MSIIFKSHCSIKLQTRIPTIGHINQNLADTFYDTCCVLETINNICIRLKGKRHVLQLTTHTIKCNNDNKITAIHNNSTKNEKFCMLLSKTVGVKYEIMQ